MISQMETKPYDQRIVMMWENEMCEVNEMCETKPYDQRIVNLNYLLIVEYMIKQVGT
jgi:hypothetical protein